MKKCKKCGVEKPLSEFYKHKRTKSGVGSYCKVCNTAVNKKWAEKNWQKRRNSNLKYYYGVDFEYFDALKEAQNNSCAICKSVFVNERHTHLDHCHTTKTIRGILCNHCNRGLGAFKDSIDILKSAQKYLEIYNKNSE